MSAAALLQAAMLAALRGDPALAGLTPVFDAPPVRAALPHAVIDEPVISDWSTKDWAGEEARLTVTIADGGERPLRLRGFVAAVAAAGCGLSGAIGDGWRVANVVLVRSRVVRSGGERWAGIVEFRVRMWRAL